jgi:predicted secreted protein
MRSKGVFFGALALVVSLGMNSAQAATSKSLTESNINQVVSVKIGSQISLTLHSTYWSLAKQSKSSALTSKGAPVIKPIFPSPAAPHGCSVVGSGCGTQTWKFVASKVGTGHLIATRTTCGEAMRCTGTNGRFEVTVKVSR